ncbi:MAG TPA: transposase [Candidatus Binatia bacterium]|nr:transposase [Candidatus Binatia bacterium]
MARPLRLEFAGAVYHLTSRGNARQKIFFNDGDRELFLDTLAHITFRYGWLCHAYCLMENHYHLLIETPKANLSLGMRQLNGIYTQSFNRRHRRVGHLFQGRFKAILVEKESYLLELCRYIVLNPVRVKGRTSPAAWKWSSYRPTAGLVAVPEFLSTDWLLEQFGQNRRVAQKRYREFVRDGIANRPWDALKAQIYLGSDKFIERHSAQDKQINEIPRVQLQAIKPTLERIFAKDRDSGIAQAYREHGYRLHEIAAHLGVHYATVSRKLKQIERRKE